MIDMLGPNHNELRRTSKQFKTFIERTLVCMRQLGNNSNRHIIPYAILPYVGPSPRRTSLVSSFLLTKHLLSQSQAVDADPENVSATLYMERVGESQKPAR